MDRADQQLRSLNQRIGRFLKGSGNGVVRKFDPDPGTRSRGRICVYANLPQPYPLAISFVIGEFIHNLRATLDNLIVHLSYRYSIEGTLNPDARLLFKTSAFPVFDAYDDFHRTTKGGGLYKIRGIDPSAAAIVEGLQPYYRGDGVSSDPLWRIEQLSNWDKHRLPHLVNHSLENVTFTATPAAGNIEVHRTEIVHPGGVVEHGALLAYSEVTLTGPHEEVDMYDRFPFEIAFNETAIGVGGRPVKPTLNDLLIYVRSVILPAFDSFYGTGPSPVV